MPSSMPHAALMDDLLLNAYRLATWLTTHVVDDPAMLAIIFC